MTRFSILFCLAGLAAAQATNRCPSTSRPIDFAAPAWNGWGPDGSNARFQPEKAAQLPVARVPRLKLKWAFGFADVKSVMGAPVVVGGRVSSAWITAPSIHWTRRRAANTGFSAPMPVCAVQ